MPANLSFEAAATAPTVYVTVLTAFQQGHAMGPGTKVCSTAWLLALLKQRQQCSYTPVRQFCWPCCTCCLTPPSPVLVCTRHVLQVLVHAGTGGVGLAAIQVARALGCQVLGSAGSPAKRSSLRRLGVAATADSRSTAFSESIAVATKGAGIDLVLNSLTSPGELLLLLCHPPFAASLPAELCQQRSGCLFRCKRVQYWLHPASLCVQAWWPPLWPACPTAGALRRSASATSGLLLASPKVRRGRHVCMAQGAEIGYLQNCIAQDTTFVSLPLCCPLFVL